MTAVTPLVVIGDGLAAGMGEFSLHAASQRASFAAQAARALGVPLATTFIEAPGVHAPAGFKAPRLSLPLRAQAAVFEAVPPPPPTNLAVPGFRLRDALERRPSPPLVQPDDPTQTACNLILGLRDLVTGSEDSATQVERAARLEPELILICLGYQEALDAVVGRHPGDCADADRLPGRHELRAGYSRILDAVGREARPVIFTIPNPADTAYCCSITDAADTCCLEPEVLRTVYGLSDDQLVTIHGLNEIAFQAFAGTPGPLPASAVIPMSIPIAVERRLGELNGELRSLASERGAAVCDLHGLFRWVAEVGVALRQRQLTGRYLGGFYGLNGIYPGAAGHAVIANALIGVLNASLGIDVPAIDVDAVAAADPVCQYEPATGRRWDLSSLPLRVSGDAPVAPLGPDTGGSVRRGGELSEKGAPGRLRLPPGGEQILSIEKASSYFGDGIAALNGSTARDIQWSSGGDYLFGGLAMVDSHLSGQVRLRFAPLGDDRAQFTMSLETGLAGEDGDLVAPQFFRMPFHDNAVTDVPGFESRGVLWLDTGEVSDLEVYAQFHSNALRALVEINPTFPRSPLTFPGQYGSAWARFTQREDGLLDFTFYGSTFVPLGDGIRWPLNFRSRDGRFASVPANGTAMHPHLHITTRPPEKDPTVASAPSLPCNEIRELTLYTHNSSFGDQFTLDVPQLGGYAKGRSHVLGRVHLQFGPRCGNSVPVAIACLRPGGILADLAPSPITGAFPGRLYPGPQGFYEFLRFPTRTYSLDDLAILDDPFDIPMASIDLQTGRSLNEVLHRGFIHQDLIFALLRVEPRTPKSSFLFRGPCQLENGPGGELAYRFKGLVRVPFPEGFLFPQPDLSTAFVVGRGSTLDPFLWLQAMEDSGARAPAEGHLVRVTSSLGETFSCRYRISPRAGDPIQFEYENHSQAGTFRMLTLSSVAFTHSRSSNSDAPDTVTFAGFGVWTKDGMDSLQQAAIQISWSGTTPYVGIQIDGGAVSNVNTKPEAELLALP